MDEKSTTDNLTNKDIEHLKLSKALKENIQMLKQIFADDVTIKFRDIENKRSDRLRGCLIFAAGMVNKTMINEDIILPLVDCDIEHILSYDELLDTLMKKIIITNEITRTKDIHTLITSMLFGDTILLIDGFDEVLLVDTKGWESRVTEEPPSEQVVKGPREGFVESLHTNISLIRKKILNPNLKFKMKQIGTQTRTEVCYCYIEGITNEKILKELERRLDKISIDGLLASNYIEELIKDAPYSPFDTIGYTERPDVAAAKLLDGRIVMLVDGSPVVSTLPFIFMEYFTINEDYYNNYLYSSFNRLLRYLSFFFATSVPAIYCAIVTFHQEILPYQLILSIASAREGVPFPTIVEALMMLIIFDILREAGVRLPAQIGPTITIFGALILGQAAVEARLVSAPLVIAVALTGMSAFLIYRLKGPIIFIRILFLLLAGFLGLYGYIFGVIGLTIHLMSIRSFGVPYMIGLGSVNIQDLKDTAIRAPWWDMQYRTKIIAAKNPKRRPDTKKN